MKLVNMMALKAVAVRLVGSSPTGGTSNKTQKITKKKPYSPHDTCECGAVKLKKSTRCEKCYKRSLERTVWPATDELVAMVEGSSFLAVASVLGVSDNAVRKRIRNHS